MAAKLGIKVSLLHKKMNCYDQVLRLTYSGHDSTLSELIVLAPNLIAPPSLGSTM